MNKKNISDQALDAIQSAPRSGKRKIVALAGAPASGKSTLAKQLSDTLCARGTPAQVVPMDGFHLDNSILIERGLLPRKGAPETFDHAGLLDLVARLKDDDNIRYPLFDRELDAALAGAGHLRADCDMVIVEGNYLLLNDPNWNALRQHWDVSILLSVPMPTLTDRLVQRWLDNGMPRDLAVKRAEENDLRNARLVDAGSAVPDVTLISA
jgi:pantothenate kinase